MGLFQMPMVKIQTYHMQQHLVAALADYNEEISNFVEAEIEWAIDEFDFSEAVRSRVGVAIQAAIKNYFTYGEGNTIITKAVEEALGEILKS